MQLTHVPVTAAKGLMVRYLVGGNLFGTPGVARNGDANFLLPLNSFELVATPEPTTPILTLLGLSLLLVRRRNR